MHWGSTGGPNWRMLAVHLAGSGMAGYVLSVALGAVFCLIAHFQLCRELRAKPGWSLAGAAALMLGPSCIHQDLVLGLMVSVQMGWVCLLLTASLRYLDGAKLALLTACTIVFVLTASSSKKALA
jgi:hypothetical protein